MALWIILTLMCSAAAVLMAVPLIRRFEERGESHGRDAGIYKDQLNEVERDKDAGLIGAAEADLAKVEIERRLLASARQIAPARPISPLWRTVAIAATTGFVVLGAINIYAVDGRPDLPAVAAVSAIRKQVVDAGTSAAPSDVGAMIEKLAAKLEKDPTDADGWRMLGWSYFNTQRYDESAAAYANAVALSPGNTGYESAYAEAMVQAAGGIVAPRAQKLFESVLKIDATEQRARFYLALAREQAGDFEASLDLWIALLADAPPDAGWLVDVRQHISELAKKTSRNVDVLLAVEAPPETKDGGSLGAVDQQAAVEAMVAKLATRLDANPHDRDGWAMMLRSLKVKGDVAGAQAALAKALQAFENDPSTRLQIAALAQSLGIAAADIASSAPAITGQDVSAVASMPAAERQAAILAMVDRLSERLAASPHDADGWVRLIRSRMVLNQRDLAYEALRKAMAEFAGDSAASERIAMSARQLGVNAD